MGKKPIDLYIRGEKRDEYFGEKKTTDQMCLNKWLWLFFFNFKTFFLGRGCFCTLPDSCLVYFYLSLSNEKQIYRIWNRSILDKKRTYCAYHILEQPNFRRYYFYFLPDQAKTHLDHFNVLERTLVPIFIQIRQRIKNFSIDPHCKNRPLSLTS